MATISGVAPQARTRPPPPRPAEGAPAVQRLAQELSDARREAEATAPLRRRIAELQSGMAQLTEELAEARAAAAVATTEAEVLRRERVSKPPPAAPPSGGDVKALRSTLESKDYEMLSLRTVLEAGEELVQVEFGDLTLRHAGRSPTP